MKNKLRKIKVGNETYLWKRAHHHLAEFQHSECVEKVTIYLEGFKNSPLQLSFREEDNLSLKANINKEKWCVGYPDSGVIWLYKYKAPSANNEPIEQRQTIEINLNRPAVIAKIITYFNRNGWNAKETSKPFVEENALKFLEIIDFPQRIN